MEFCHEGKEVKLQGEHIMISTPFKGKKFNKLATVEGISEFFQLSVVMEQNGSDESNFKTPEVVRSLLQQYEEVFQEPKGLTTSEGGGPPHTSGT